MRAKNLLEFQTKPQKLDSVISRADLLEKIKEDYNLGEYETSITKAFKYLEESYISLNFQTKNAISISNNFSTKLLDDKAFTELKSLHIKMLGAMHWIKNLTDAANESREAAAQILSYVDLQLKLLNEKEN